MSRPAAAEQKYWDEIAKSMLSLCWSRTKKVEGCTQLAREIADSMLAERRQSINEDKR